MYEAVTMPSLMMMTSIVSEESLATDTHAHGQTWFWLYSKICKVTYDFASKNIKYVEPYEMGLAHWVVRLLWFT